MIGRLRTALQRAFFDAYKAYKQRNARLTPEHALSVARKMLDRTTYCFLIAQGSDSSASAQLVQPIVDDTDPFTLWIGTSPTLRKIREVEAYPHVTVAVEDERDGAYLVLYGTTRLERDPDVRRKRWKAAWRMFFPDGPTSSDYVLIRFDAARMELMNFRRNLVAEPFGLRPMRLVREGEWRLDDVVET